MVNVGITKVYKNNQITVPSTIRKALGITEESLIKWDLKSDGTVSLSVLSEKPSIRDFAGIAHSKEVTNAVELKRGLYL